jgi:hypothetical protein
LEGVGRFQWTKQEWHELMASNATKLFLSKQQARIHAALTLIASGYSEEPDSWKDADHGYNNAFGSKDEYRRAYRTAFEAGYRGGYGGR